MTSRTNNNDRAAQERGYYSAASERHARQTKARAEARARAAHDAQWAKYTQAMREKNRD
jgi:hypothetical protein